MVPNKTDLQLSDHYILIIGRLNYVINTATQTQCFPRNILTVKKVKLFRISFHFYSYAATWRVFVLLNRIGRLSAFLNRFFFNPDKRNSTGNLYFGDSRNDTMSQSFQVTNLHLLYIFTSSIKIQPQIWLFLFFIYKEIKRK